MRAMIHHFSKSVWLRYDKGAWNSNAGPNQEGLYLGTVFILHPPPHLCCLRNQVSMEDSCLSSEDLDFYNIKSAVTQSWTPLNFQQALFFYSKGQNTVLEMKEKKNYNLFCALGRGRQYLATKLPICGKKSKAPAGRWQRLRGESHRDVFLHQS